MPEGDILLKRYSLIFADETGNEPSEDPNGQRVPKLFPVKELRPTDLVFSFVLLFLCTACGVLDSVSTVFLAAPTAALYAAYCLRRKSFSLLFSVCGALSSLIVTMNGYRAAGALFAGLLAFCLFDAVSGEDKRRAKTSAVARCTVSLWGYVLLLCLIFRLFHPEFDFSAAINNAFSQVEKESLSQLSALYSMPGFSDALLGALPDNTVTLESLSDAVRYTVLQTKYLSPALLTVLFLTLSYPTASLFKGFCNLLKVREPFAGVPFEITLSSVSLFCYFIVSLGMLFARGNAYLYCRNIAYILSPGFMLCGVKQIGAFFERRGLSKAALRAIQTGGTVLAVLLGNLGTTILILLGMLYTLNNEVRHPNRK